MQILFLTGKTFACHAQIRFRSNRRFYSFYPFMLACLLIALHTTLPLLHELPDNVFIIIQQVFSIILIVDVTWVLINVVRVSTRTIARYGEKKENNQSTERVKVYSVMIRRFLIAFIIFIAVAATVLTFPGAWEMGVSMLVGAGVLSVVIGVAIRPLVEDLLTSLQVAITEPFLLFDQVTVDNYYGKIEEIHMFHAVLKAPDDSRYIVPLSRFTKQPFQNWTKGCNHKVGEVKLIVDYNIPVASLRNQLQKVVAACPFWDQRKAILKVTNSTEFSVQITCYVSSVNIDTQHELTCYVREKMLDYIVTHFRPNVPHEVSRRAGGLERASSSESSEPGHHWFEHLKKPY
ncbi:hypothetical protein K7432_010622 [Basidiobolus ranarum]|uniref:Mechanosensitive ion channel MscS domain-containing protein n=1 Tax=Basidiobolus ranarum TaxID=34480 RepID=A0ABR2VVZ5_9FUNG